MDKKETILKFAQSLGFSLIGFSSSLDKKYTDLYSWWVQSGFSAGMFYLKAQEEKRANIEEVLPGAKTVMICAMPFAGGGDSSSIEAGYGSIARYASDRDYHLELKPLVTKIADKIDSLYSAKSIAYVDTGPISERAYAANAGLGWIGKNAMLINKDWGSWLWLSSIITTAEIPHDTITTDHCGKCRKCLDACPTNAILDEVRMIDSNRCISYWNIESKGSIPREISDHMSPWLLGCDICQEVCPWNEHSLKKSRSVLGSPKKEQISLSELQKMTKEEFQSKYKDSALSRPRWQGIQRNVSLLK
ncbi:MAG: tRNA epoxyqueuosine(34) reductase QueG [Oligoflexia bacterium]|nr:tRNA epoxyqueuosine(34) reductase QueG [Oligoflexia bacterium]